MRDRNPPGYTTVAKFLGGEVLTSDRRVVVLGTPIPMDDDDPDAHNCDAMGCGSASMHVVAIVDRHAPTNDPILAARYRCDGAPHQSACDWTGPASDSADPDADNVEPGCPRCGGRVVAIVSPAPSPVPRGEAVDIKAARELAAAVRGLTAGASESEGAEIFSIGQVRQLARAVLACTPPDLAAAVRSLPDLPSTVASAADYDVEMLCKARDGLIDDVTGLERDLATANARIAAMGLAISDAESVIRALEAVANNGANLLEVNSDKPARREWAKSIRDQIAAVLRPLTTSPATATTEDKP